MADIHTCPMCDNEFLELHSVHVSETVTGEIKVCEDCRDDHFVQCPKCMEWDTPELHGKYTICFWCVEELVTKHEREAGYKKESVAV